MDKIKSENKTVSKKDQAIQTDESFISQEQHVYLKNEKEFLEKTLYYEEEQYTHLLYRVKKEDEIQNLLKINIQKENKIEHLQIKTKKLDEKIKELELEAEKLGEKVIEKDLQINKLTNLCRQLQTGMESTGKLHEERSQLDRIKRVWLDQIMSFKNYYLFYLATFADKCKGMMLEINDLKKYTTDNTIPSLTEIDGDLLLWENSLECSTIKFAITCQFYDQLINKLCSNDFQHPIAFPCLSLMPEPPNGFLKYLKKILVDSKRLEEDLNMANSCTASGSRMPYTHTICDTNLPETNEDFNLELEKLTVSQEQNAEEEIRTTPSNFESPQEVTGVEPISCWQEKPIPTENYVIEEKMPEDTMPPAPPKIVLGPADLLDVLQKKFSYTPVYILQAAITLLQKARGDLSGLDSTTLLTELEKVINKLCTLLSHGTWTPIDEVPQSMSGNEESSSLNTEVKHSCSGTEKSSSSAPINTEGKRSVSEIEEYSLWTPKNFEIEQSFSGTGKSSSWTAMNTPVEQSFTGTEEPSSRTPRNTVVNQSFSGTGKSSSWTSTNTGIKESFSGIEQSSPWTAMNTEADQSLSGNESSSRIPAPANIVLSPADLLLILQKKFPHTPVRILQTSISILRKERGSLLGLDSITLLPDLTNIITDLCKLISSPANNISFSGIENSEESNSCTTMSNEVKQWCQKNLGYCTICQNILTTENNRQLICQHTFHIPCIKLWFLHNEICPTCGRYVRKTYN